MSSTRGRPVLPWVAAALLAVAAMVGAPDAGVAASALAALAALLSLRHASRFGKVAGAVLLVLSLALAVSLYPAAARSREAQRAAGQRPAEPRHPSP